MSLKSIISKVLKVEEKDINDSTSKDNTDNWDSFNSLVIISELEEEYKVRFTMKEVIGIKSVGDIRKILKEHGVDY